MEQTFDKALNDCNQQSGTGAGNLRVPFGLREGRIWSPRQVAPGKACACYCPACGGALVAKALSSRRRRPHFAHLKEGNCRAGYETAIHLKAKQLIVEERRLWLPAWDGTKSMPNPPQLRDSEGFYLTGCRVEFPAREVTLADATPELHQGDYVPDVYAHDEDGELLLEIRVTHAVDEVKQRRVESEGRRLVEIDLSGLRAAQVYDEIEFRRVVLTEVSNRHWLSCPPATEAWRASLRDLKSALAERESEIARRKAEREALSRRQQAEREQAAAKAAHKQANKERFRQQLRARYQHQLELLPRLVAPDRVAALMEQYRVEGEQTAARLLEDCPAHVRPLMSIHHRDAWIYGVYPALWQLRVYRHFVQRASHGREFNQREVAAWVLRTFPTERPLHDLFVAQYRARAQAREAGFRQFAIRSWAFTPEENAAIPDFYRPINHLMARLVDAGSLRPIAGQRGQLLVTSQPVRPAPGIRITP